MSKRPNRIKMWLVGLACGAIPLITTATCDPYTGFLDIYRDDDGYYYDSGYYDVYYYDDCDIFFCF